MKKLLLLFVFISAFSLSSKAQCNATSMSPITICYPSQTKSIAQTVQTDIIYLCGAGSVVYDTLTPPGIKYRIVYVNAGAVYHYNSTLTNNNITIYAKSGSQVIIHAGANTSSFFIYNKETGATLTNLSAGIVTTNTCPAIAGPSVNCVPAGIANVAANDTQTNVWPNPAHDKLFISSESGKDKTVSIVNLIGETVYTIKGLKDEKQEISLSTFASGIYYVVIKGDGLTETKKIVITH